MRNLKKTINAAICFVLTLAMILPANVKANAAENVPASGNYSVEAYEAMKDQLDALVAEGYTVSAVKHDEVRNECDLEEHEHDDNCYTLICEDEEHEHTDDCYGLTCTKEVHEHDDDCYGLTCDKTAHTHTEACIGTTCGEEDHIHNADECYEYYVSGKKYNLWSWILKLISWGFIDLGEDTIDTRLVCTKHVHNDSCYGYTCGLEEHTHDEDACYGLTCTKEVHVHDDDCNGLICEVTPHTHGDDCNGLICEVTPHTHSDECSGIIAEAYYAVTITAPVPANNENNNENQNNNENEKPVVEPINSNGDDKQPVVEPVDNDNSNQETTPDVVEDGSDDKEQPAENSNNDEQPATDAPAADNSTIVPAAPINNVPFIILPAWTAENTDDAEVEEAAPAAEEIVDVDTTPATPEGAVEEDVEAEVSEPTVVDDTEEEVDVDTTPATPQGAVEEEPEAEEETEDLGLDIVATPQGDVLPQTGVLSAVVFYGLGAICIAIGGATLVKVRRKEQD